MIRGGMHQSVIFSETPDTREYEQKRTGRWNAMSFRVETIKTGISFGTALAMVISFTMNKSVLWAMFHGLLSWVYVIYYVIVY